MSEGQSPKPRGTPTGRGVKIVLAVSLALNLAVLGVVAGIALGDRGPRGEAGVPPLVTMGLAPFVFALSRDERADLRTRLSQEAEPLRAERRAIGRTLRDITGALTTEPFDRARMEAALGQARQSGLRLQATGHAALLAQVEAMSPGERADFAERLERRMRRFGGDRGADRAGD